MDYLIICALIVEVVILSLVDRRIFGTWLTPVSLLSCPYVAVLVSAFLFAPALGFVPVYAPSITIWMAGLPIFSVVSIVAGCLFGRLGTTHPFQTDERLRNHDFPAVKLAIWVAWAALPLMAYGLREAVLTSGGWTEIGGWDFRVAYSHGIGAHAVVLAFPLVVLLVGTYQKGHKLQLVTISGLLLFLFVSQVKGTLLAPLLGGMVFRVARGALKLTLTRIIAGIGSTFLLFNLIYILGWSAADPRFLDDSDTYLYLSRHYLFYLWSGVLAFSEALRRHVGFVGGPWYTIFAPFLNVYHVLCGAGHIVDAGSLHELGMETDLGATHGVNTYTMVGTLYLYLGFFGTLLILLGIAILFYGLLVACRVSANPWLLTLYSIQVSWLIVGFFEYYFWYLTSLEVAFYCFILAVLQGGRFTLETVGTPSLESEVAAL